MTALLLALLLVGPIQPVTYQWTLAPVPEPPAVPPPNWVPFRLDELAVTVRATETAFVWSAAYYRIAGRPELGWVSWRAPIPASFAAGQYRQLVFEIPYVDYAPGPILFAVWQDCGDGRMDYQGGFIPRLGQTLAPPFDAMPFSALSAGSFCPAYTPPTAIFSDGFETGSLRAWSALGAAGLGGEG
ncbi:MAG: hypothetical protein BWX64_01591 [Acidobacteria bacterium ADurb.Bin051]|nr:MAG: hypothetical protein BWX64_01591 [Acidobacteria bacterium ADurb.Bin051]